MSNSLLELLGRRLGARRTSFGLVDSLPEMQLPQIITALRSRLYPAFSVCRNRKCRTDPSLYQTRPDSKSCLGTWRRRGRFRRLKVDWESRRQKRSPPRTWGGLASSTRPEVNDGWCGKLRHHPREDFRGHCEDCLHHRRVGCCPHLQTSGLAQSKCG